MIYILISIWIILIRKFIENMLEANKDQDKYSKKEYKIQFYIIKLLSD